MRKNVLIMSFNIMFVLFMMFVLFSENVKAEEIDGVEINDYLYDSADRVPHYEIPEKYIDGASTPNKNFKFKHYLVYDSVSSSSGKRNYYMLCVDGAPFNISVVDGKIKIGYFNGTFNAEILSKSVTLLASSDGTTWSYRNRYTNYYQKTLTNGYHVIYSDCHIRSLSGEIVLRAGQYDKNGGISKAVKEGVYCGIKASDLLYEKSTMIPQFDIPEDIELKYKYIMLFYDDGAKRYYMFVSNNIPFYAFENGTMSPSYGYLASYGVNEEWASYKSNNAVDWELERTYTGVCTRYVNPINLKFVYLNFDLKTVDGDVFISEKNFSMVLPETPDTETPDTETPKKEEDIKASENTFDLKKLFPFCVPYDLIDFIKVLQADPRAPYVEIPITYPVSLDFKQVETYNVVIDFSKFNYVAKIVRKMETIVFMVGLVLITRNHMIKG